VVYTDIVALLLSDRNEGRRVVHYIQGVSEKVGALLGVNSPAQK
jgi:hypothetical protein